MTARIWSPASASFAVLKRCERPHPIAAPSVGFAHHHASRLRDAHLRRRYGIRNTLWFTWLRRPLPCAALRAARLPRDRFSAQGIGDTVLGLPWVLRERNPVPAYVERGSRQLQAMQLNGRTRDYVS